MEFQVNVWATVKILTTSSYNLIRNCQTSYRIIYTAAEYAEMLIIYGECRRNAREYAREYTIRFPRRLPYPNYNVFLWLVYRARDTGSLVPT
jgi:hypothetical protein